MKIVFITLLILNFLGEALASLSLINGPEGLSAAGTGGQWSMHYGFAVISIASISIWLWLQRQNLPTVTALLGVLSTFHISVLLSLAIAGDQMGGVVIHAVLSVLSITCLLRRHQISNG